jgi:hypothetical protein
MKTVADRCQDYYDVILVGTGFKDGHYTRKESAEEVAEYFRNVRFPNIEAKVQNVGTWHPLLDEYFWATPGNHEKLILINERMGSMADSKVIHLRPQDETEGEG